MDKATNYEEAKLIIKNSINDEMQEKALKNAKLRSLFIVGIGISAAIAEGIITQNPLMGAVDLPNALIFTAPFTIPYFMRKRTKNRIIDGSYFEDKTEAQIMEAANDYVERHNRYEEKHGGKSL